MSEPRLFVDASDKYRLCYSDGEKCVGLPTIDEMPEVDVDDEAQKCVEGPSWFVKPAGNSGS